MIENDRRWVIVSGGGGALGSALAAHYSSQGRRVLALDRRFDPAEALPPGIATRNVDLLAEEEVRRAIAENLDTNDGISLLVNAVGQIWNEPLVAFRGAKLATH